VFEDDEAVDASRQLPLSASTPFGEERGRVLSTRFWLVCTAPFRTCVATCSCWFLICAAGCSEACPGQVGWAVLVPADGEAALGHKSTAPEPGPMDRDPAAAVCRRGPTGHSRCWR
jgi:hypothetical protein